MSAHAEIQGFASGSQGERANPDGIEIEALHGIAHAREVEQLQMDIWSGNEAWIVPSHVLLIVSDSGGVLLGARREGALIGFVLGFLGHSNGRLIHASHMLGVHPSFQQHGVGAALKWSQREAVRRQGIDLMRWTFDPLEARNAYFNFHKLGTVCSVYHPNYYGPMQDGLNKDLPSDRLLVEWRLNEEERRSIPAETPRTILRNKEGKPHLQIDLIGTDAPLAIEIPRDLQAMKSEAPDLALSWRLAVRQAFLASFERGYVACDFRDGAYTLLPRKEQVNEN